MIRLLPRLSRAMADDLIQPWLEPEASAAPAFDERHLSLDGIWAATGGTRTGRPDLLRLRQTILDAAEGAGFPDPCKDVQKAAFDARCAEALAGLDLLSTPEAMRDDVWSFIAIVLAPEVAFWRFGATP